MWGIGKPFYTKLKKHKSAKHTEEWGYKLGLAGIQGNTNYKAEETCEFKSCGYWVQQCGCGFGAPWTGSPPYLKSKWDGKSDY